jgi:hypothetical protein
MLESYTAWGARPAVRGGEVVDGPLIETRESIRSIVVVESLNRCVGNSFRLVRKTDK